MPKLLLDFSSSRHFTHQFGMTDDDEYFEDFSDNSSIELSGVDEDVLGNELSSVDISDSGEYEFDDGPGNTDSSSEILYSFYKSRTSGGIPTHRLKYRNIALDDIQKELEKDVKKVQNMLQLDYGKCLNLLLQYSWNEHKMLDMYMNAPNHQEYLLKNGIYEAKFPEDLSRLISTETDENILCGICYCGPTKDEPMNFFSMYGCKHKFCTDCYIQYLKNKNESGSMAIECPFADPKCHLKITIEELNVLSEYNNKMEEKHFYHKKQEECNLLSEEQIKQMYKLDSDSEFEFDEQLDVEDDFNNTVKTKEKMKIDELVYDFHTIIQQREREEIDKKRNRTIISKYWYNIGSRYCTINTKKYKHCPFPDCDNVVQFIGFDSDIVANIEELKRLLMIPLVRCKSNHQFCFGCNETAHAPCPCKVVQLWKIKCEDDSETLNWIQTNTKDCPRCHSLIEKNGGCNHMTCKSCTYNFCWICLGDWTAHKNNYRCDKYVPNEDSDVGKVRESLEKYMFYFNHFNNQRISHDKDKQILEIFENKIKELQINSGVSWIESVFYKECVNALLECRESLKWSYAFLFYIPNCRGKQLIETAQWQLSNKVEQLSRLFEDVEIGDVIKKKPMFLTIKSSMVTAQNVFLETCIDIFADKHTLKDFVQRWNIK